MSVESQPKFQRYVPEDTIHCSNQCKNLLSNTARLNTENIPAIKYAFHISL
jgi:hypothetical protein